MSHIMSLYSPPVMSTKLSRKISEKYPHLLFKRNWEIIPSITSLISECNVYIKAISNSPISPSRHSQLLNVSLIKGAQATTAIEGNNLTEAEIEKVVKGQSIGTSREYQATEVKNVVDALNTLLHEVAFLNKVSVITPELIRRFHELIGKNLGKHLDARPGHFREDSRVVGHYQCPDHIYVEELINQLCDWLKKEFGFLSNNQSFQDVVLQAIITHIYLEWIHPFGDGNGRTGRLLEFYILLRGGLPDIASHILSNHYNTTRSEYYKHFDNARKKGDLTEFIEYALHGYRDGLETTLETVLTSQLETTWQKYIYDKFHDEAGDRAANKRRRKLVLSMVFDRGYLLNEINLISPEVAREYATLSVRSIIRDLKELERMALVYRKDGDKRYYANISQLQLKGHFPHLRILAQKDN